MSLLRQAKPTPTPFSSDWEQASECDEELWGIMRDVRIIVPRSDRTKCMVLYRQSIRSQSVVALAIG